MSTAMDAWDQAQEDLDKHRSTGGRFLKLGDGDRVVGCFVGESRPDARVPLLYAIREALIVSMNARSGGGTYRLPG
jgi:hypothetical protein